MQLGRYLSSCALGLLALILIYTGFGYVLVSLHAGQLAGEMRLLAAHGLPALIAANDYFLASAAARLGSASLFGLTLGPLAAVILSLWAWPAWRRGRLNRTDVLIGLALGLILAGLSFSREIFWLAPLTALLAIAAFWVCLCGVPRRPQVERPASRTAAVLVAVVLLPPILLGTTSYFAVRDVMLMNPLLAALNRFYYDHTLLAADVIKPPLARSQPVIAAYDDGARIDRRIPGSLVLLTPQPEQVGAARIRLSREFQPAGQKRFDLGGAVMAFSASRDSNRWLRQGIGMGLLSLKLVMLGLAVWLGLGLSRLWSSNRATCIVLTLCYYALFWPIAQAGLQGALLRFNPELLAAYASSNSETQRYIAAASAELDATSLDRLIRDRSPRVRLTALVNAGQRRDSSLLPACLGALNDPQINVRTKACWALGRLADRSALGPLYARIMSDDSWYVRDYAWAALNRIQPVARIVRLNSP
ncbi:MAG: HEAT repeat protein [Deltaproteobacteria bacterium ADurb.Bin510]|nr:MAG: HEAT repeat protein [Deltaproteobacteria bacterium ADurb.Bin510]